MHLRLNNVCKRYGKSDALHPISLSFPAAKTTALIGPSGSGKSTILRILVGLVAADEGDVFFEDEALSARNVRHIRHRMGYMIQEGGLFPHLTVRGNVTLLARHLGRSEKHCRARCAELARLTRLPEELLDRYPRQISGGQRQRAALMRALFLDPAVLLLDEPMGSLDPMIRYELQNELREIFRSLHKTVVLVTHDIGEAGFLADTIAVLRAGRVVQQGTYQQLVSSPADEFVARFVSSQQIDRPAPSDPSA